VAAASGRTVSFSIPSAAGRSDGGSSPFCGRPSARATTRTREPSPAASATRPLAAFPAPIRTSAPPTNHDPCSPNDTALHFRADENGTDAVDDQPVGADGNRSPIADIVAFGCSSAAAIAASASSTLGPPSSGSTATTESLPAVSVPVLSMQSTSTRASPFDGGQLLHEHVALRQPEDRDGERQAHQQDQPFGHGHRARRPPSNGDAPAVVMAQLAHEQQRGRRHDRDRHPSQDLIDTVAELRSREREPLGLQRQLDRIRVGTHGGRHHAAGARSHERPRHRLVTGLLLDGLRLAGEQRFVQLQPVGRDHAPVHDHLHARRQLQDVVRTARSTGTSCTRPSRTTVPSAR
jgi:hypothetical protein